MATEPQQTVYYDPPDAPFATQKSEVRAEIGRTVGAALDSNTRTWRLGSSPERPVQLYIRENFLSPDECRLLCEKIDANLYPSPLYEKDKYEGIRTSQSCNLDVHDPFVADIDTRIAAMLGIDRARGEPLQGQRYEVRQEFRAHADFFYVDQPYWAEYEPHGGQRTWTAMIYLNEPASGGATAFTYLDLSVMPRLGRILIWNNMALDGSPNPWTDHAGQPVGDGIKYIVTKWFRERTFV
jgi:prolyl 4-hydroxylase